MVKGTRFEQVKRAIKYSSQYENWGRGPYYALVEAWQLGLFCIGTLLGWQRRVETVPDRFTGPWISEGAYVIFAHPWLPITYLWIDKK